MAQIGGWLVREPEGFERKWHHGTRGERGQKNTFSKIFQKKIPLRKHKKFGKIPFSEGASSKKNIFFPVFSSLANRPAAISLVLHTHLHTAHTRAG